MAVSHDQFIESMAEVLEVDGAVLRPETVLADLPGYDSVKTLSLIVTLDEMGINISQCEVSGFRTFGDILNTACRKGVLS
jgi:acyl carrier protein